MPSLTPTHDILSSSQPTKQNCFCESEPIKDASLEAEADQQQQEQGFLCQVLPKKFCCQKLST